MFKHRQSFVEAYNSQRHVETSLKRFTISAESFRFLDAVESKVETLCTTMCLVRTIWDREPAQFPRPLNKLIVNMIGQMFYRIWRVPKKSGNLGNQLKRKENKAHFKRAPFQSMSQP